MQKIEVRCWNSWNWCVSFLYFSCESKGMCLLAFWNHIKRIRWQWRKTNTEWNRIQAATWNCAPTTQSQITNNVHAIICRLRSSAIIYCFKCILCNFMTTVLTKGTAQEKMGEKMWPINHINMLNISIFMHFDQVRNETTDGEKEERKERQKQK